ncbi:MAG: hypothetical protein U1A27_10720 [Phycisphaerae bacterium]
MGSGSMIDVFSLISDVFFQFLGMMIDFALSFLRQGLAAVLL